MQYILYIANFLFLLNQDTRKLIRNIENIEKKLIDCQLAVVFNKTCLNEDILPVYSNTYIYIYICLHFDRFY